jgi:hypothetical protein
MAYIPLSQLVRIEAIPRGGIFLNFRKLPSEHEIANGGRLELQRACRRLSSESQPYRLNAETLDVTDIHF